MDRVSPDALGFAGLCCLRIWRGVEHLLRWGWRRGGRPWSGLSAIAEERSDGGSGTVGRREPPPGWPVACCGRRMRVITSHESGWRGICCRRALVASCVMLPRVFPEGTSREGGTRLREAPGLDAALHTKSHVPGGPQIT
jgi:hypothetical protein